MTVTTVTLVGPKKLTSTMVSQRNSLATKRKVRVLSTPIVPTLSTNYASIAAAIAASSVTTNAAGLRTLQRVNPANNTATEPIDMANDVNFAYLGTPSCIWNYGISGSAELTGTTSHRKWMMSLVSTVYADTIEIIFTALNSQIEYRLWIDDERNTEDMVYLTGLTSGQVYRLTLPLGTLKTRKIQIDWPDNGFNGVLAKPIHSIERYKFPADLPITVAMGDSVTAGANESAGTAGFTRGDSWLSYMAEIMGWDNVYNVSIAGTGFINAGSEASMVNRLQDISIPGARYVSYFGLNDVSYVSTTLPGAIDTVFARIQSMNPLEFIVFGCHPMQASTISNGAYIALNNLLKAKAAQYGAKFVDTFALKWVTGTGTISATKGDGNADLFINGDGIHPTREGAKYLGRINATGIIAAG